VPCFTSTICRTQGEDGAWTGEFALRASPRFLWAAHAAGLQEDVT